MAGRDRPPQGQVTGTTVQERITLTHISRGSSYTIRSSYPSQTAGSTWGQRESLFYLEADGMRKKRVIVKVMGEQAEINRYRIFDFNLTVSPANMNLPLPR